MFVCGVQGSAKLYFQNISFLQSSKASVSYGSEDFTQSIAQNWGTLRGELKMSSGLIAVVFAVLTVAFN